jgi:hypothetical protein
VYSTDEAGLGHLEFNKAYERLRKGATWPEMYDELKAYAGSCDFCQRNNTSSQKTVCVLKRLEIPTVSSEHVSLDFITSMLETKAIHDAVMVIVDRLAKLVTFIRTRTYMDTVKTRSCFSIIGISGLVYRRK